jgi:processive 1,2-diacylglycerol beta-glucosyltransferase
VTDYRAHAVWAEPDVDALCVPCHRALDDLIRHGFDAARVHMTGMPVRTAFERAAPVDDPPAGEALRVLVTGGGFGIGPVLAVARSFAGIADMELEVVCGRAPHLAAVVEQVARRTHTPAHVLGFERDMAARVAAAHVIVGKAGGLTVTESLAAGRPMVIAGSVPGNEILNARFVASAGAAVIAHPADVGRAAARLRATGGIARMGRRARQLAPGGAADRVVDVALSGAGAAADATPRLGPDALVVGDLQPESIRPIGERDFRSRSPIYTPRFV